MKRSKSAKKTKSTADPCWKDYKKLGMKIKNGKKVPDCVPVKKELNELHSALFNLIKLRSG